MAGKSRSQSKRRAQGGGRTSNTEPRVQVFKGFAGMNFEHYPEMPPVKVINGKDWSNDASQEDLVMTQFELLKNVQITNNMTLESVPSLEKVDLGPTKMNLLEENKIALTGPTCLVGSWLFYAYENATDGSVGVGKAFLGDHASGDEVADIEFVRNSFVPHGDITCISWAQNRLLIIDSFGQVWRSQIVDAKFYQSEVGGIISNVYGAVEIPKPSKLQASFVSGHGSLKFSEEYSDEFPYRIRLAYCVNTEFGPTEVSDALVLYSNIEIAEWNEIDYAMISISIDECYIPGAWYGAVSASLYYTVDDAYEYQFAQMADFTQSFPSKYGVATINWYGYLTDISAWEFANLDAPSSNYTYGPYAKYCRTIDGKIYFWGGGTRQHPDYRPAKVCPDYRIFIGGNPGNMLSISPATGGGFVDIEPGSGKRVHDVVKYKTVSGADIVTALCGCRNSYEEYRYNLVRSTVSISQENSTVSWQAEQVSGSTGCRSVLSSLVCEDGLYTVSRYGLALTTIAMEYNNQIRTSYVSDPIKPVFLAQDTTITSADDDKRFKEFLLHCDGVIYYGRNLYAGTRTSSVVFCYDVNLKAWWSITIPDEVRWIDHMDSEKHAEGVSFVCMSGIWVLPTTDQIFDYSALTCPQEKIVESAMISTSQPNHGYHHLTQIEFDFDYFKGRMKFEIVGIDIFGRSVKTEKWVDTSDNTTYGLEVYLRVDLKLREYKIRLIGDANCEFRLNCFQSKLYVMNNKNGLVWGFDDMQSFRSDGDIQRTFKNYNDVVDAIIP